MDFRQILSMARRWAWLLALGAVAGIGVAYVLSLYEQPVYQASTKVLVAQPRESNVGANIASFSDQELVQTYMALLVTDPVLEATSERLGYSVQASQISARQEQGTRLLQVTARSSDPQRAAATANTVVEVLIERNDTLQSGRFAAAEESLQAQISQVEAQIEAAESELNQSSEGDIESVQEELEQRIALLQTNIIDLQLEIDELSSLSAEEQALLNEKRLELARLRLALSVEQNSYNSRLLQDPNARNEETEQRIVELQETVIALEQEIDELTNGRLSDDPQLRGTISAKELELARLRAILSRLDDRYVSLLAGSAGAGGEDDVQQNRENSLTLYQQLRSNLLSAYESTRLARLQNTPNVVQVEEASVPTTPIAPQVRQMMVRGAIIGLLFASGIAYAIEFLDDTIKSPDDVQHLTGLPTLAGIGHMKTDANGGREVVTLKQPRSPISEAFRALRTGILFSAADNPNQALLITSPSPTAGKSLVAANLAVVMAQANHSVLLIDADLRRPVQHKIFEKQNRRGLTTLLLSLYQSGLTDEIDAQVEAITQTTAQDGLKLITTGSLPPNPSELLGSVKMKTVLRYLKHKYDFIILDSPPALAVTDAVVLGAQVDSVLVLVNAGETKSRQLSQVVERLHDVNANVIGVALNRLSPREGGYYNYYYSKDAYGHGGDGNARPQRRRRKGEGVRALWHRLRSGSAPDAGH